MFSFLSLSSPVFAQQTPFADLIPPGEVRDEDLPASDGGESMIYRGTRCELPSAKADGEPQSALTMVYRGTIGFFRCATPQSAEPAERTMIYRGTTFTM
jgi:hypothetical protein